MTDGPADERCETCHRLDPINCPCIPEEITRPPCLTCGERERMPRGSYCRPCATDYERERRRANADVINARQRSRYTPEKGLRNKLRRYNLTPEQYAALLDAQGGRCAICRGEMPEPHVDHDHACCPERLRSCGRCVRGLLCPSCNNGLGRFRDTPEWLISAAFYLVTPLEFRS